MQMAFTLASHVQAWMVDTQQAEEELRINPRVEEQAETKRRQGTLLTRENFMEWKIRFDAEQRATREVVEEQGSGQTGRQLFETDATLFDDEEGAWATGLEGLRCGPV